MKRIPKRAPRCLGRDLESAARALSAAVDRIAELQPEYDQVNLSGPEAARWEVWYTEKWNPAESAMQAANDQLIELMNDQGISALFVAGLGRLFTDIGGDVVEGLTAYPESIGVHSLKAVRGMVPADG